MKITRVLAAIFALSLLAGCYTPAPPSEPTPTPVREGTPLAFAVTLVTEEAEPDATPLPSATPTPTPSPYPWTDENAVMGGICFESALDAVGRTFVLRNAEAHIRFYDLADNSNLCRQPVTRNPFDFSGGRILAGLWSAGRGCTARHDVENVVRDDTARTFFIFLRFVTEGDCNYELARGFWIGLDGLSEYDVQFVVE